MSENSGTNSTVALRYALALFELATEAGVVDAVGADLERFVALMAESADLSELVRSPIFSKDEQLRAVSAVADAVGITGLAANFIKLTASNRRLNTLPEAAAAYARLVRDSRGEDMADVTVAHPLTDADAAELTSLLSSKTGKTIRLTSRVDPSLIGGLIVKIGSRLIDTSLKTKLNSLKIALKEVR